MHKIRIGPQLHKVPSSVSVLVKSVVVGIMADKGLVLSFVLVGRPYKSIYNEYRVLIGGNVYIFKKLQ